MPRPVPVGRLSGREVRCLLLPYPHACLPPPAHDPAYRFDLRGGGRAEPDLVHRLAYVVRREPFEHPRGVQPPQRAPGAEREEFHTQLPRALATVQPPHFTHPHLAVAPGLPLVGVRDLDLHHQIRRDVLEVGVGLRLPFGEGRQIPSGAFADVELAVRLHPRAGRLAPTPQTGAAQPPCRAGENAARGLHDVVQDPGQVVMEA